MDLADWTSAALVAVAVGFALWRFQRTPKPPAAPDLNAFVRKAGTLAPMNADMPNPSSSDGRWAGSGAALDFLGCATLVAVLGAAAYFGYSWWEKRPSDCYTLAKVEAELCVTERVFDSECVDRNEWERAGGAIACLAPEKAAVFVRDAGRKACRHVHVESSCPRPK